MITKDSKNILVADDSAFFRTKIRDIFIEAGHRVRFASGGRDAVKSIRENSEDLDLLSLDLEMPGFDGFHVLEWISENGFKGRFPILVITAIYHPGNVIERLKNLGASELITKDFSPQQLVLEANKLLFREKAGKGTNPRGRVPVSIPADFMTRGEAREGFLLNISKSGAYLNTEYALKRGERLHLKFILPGIDKAFDLDCVVKWTTGDITNRTRFCGGGVMFTSISPVQEEVIKDFIVAESRRLEQYDMKAKAPSQTPGEDG